MDNRKEIVENILSELNGRSGFDDWWYNIDEDIQNEITETLVNLLPIHNVSGSTETDLIDPNNCPYRASGFCTA